MYFERIRKEYMEAVVALEQGVYPEGLSLGKEELLEEYQAGAYEHSICGFLNGELKCYILASKVTKGEEEFIYISDLNCKNPKYLQRLLVFFFSNGRNQNNSPEYVADLRECSYRLLKRRSSRNPEYVRILEDTVENGYYPNGEDARQVRFTMSLDKLICENWKTAFQLKIDGLQLEEWVDFFDVVTPHLGALVSQGIDITADKNRKFIYKCLEEKVVGYYQMFGERIPAVGFRELFSREKNHGIHSYRKSIQTLEKYGYQNREGADKEYGYNKYRNTLELSAKYEVFNTKYPGTLSGYRWLYRREKRFARKYQYTLYYDRYGSRRSLIQVPYMNQNRLLYLFEKIKYIHEKAAGLEVVRPEKKHMTDMCEIIWKLLNRRDARNCIDSIVSHYQISIPDYFSGWETVTKTVNVYARVLTPGAMKAILSSPYSQADKICKNLDRIDEIILGDAQCLQMIGEKMLRRRISSVIRRGEDMDPLIGSLTETVNLKYMKVMRIPVKRKEMAVEFVRRMQNYCPTVTLRTVYKRYGRNIFLSYLYGTYPCVFSRQVCSPEFLTAGDASVCCMGFSCEKAQVYTREKGFGILNAYYRDRVIANSLLWINEPYHCLVLDNVEVHPNYVKYREQLRMGFLHSAEQIMQQYHLDFAVQGTQFNDLFLYYEDCKLYRFAKMEARDVGQPFYTDAAQVKVIRSNLTEAELDRLFERVKEKEGQEDENIFLELEAA